MLSRTQVMLTKIAELCKEIRVIKSNQINKGLFTPKGAKMINSTSKLSKFTNRNIPAGKGNDASDDLHDGYYGGKISNPQNHPNNSIDTIHDCGGNHAQTLSSLTPPLPSHSHTLLPPPSESLVKLVTLKHDLSVGIPIDSSGAKQYSSSSILVRMVISTEHLDTTEENCKEWWGEEE